MDDWGCGLASHRAGIARGPSVTGRPRVRIIVAVVVAVAGLLVLANLLVPPAGDPTIRGDRAIVYAPSATPSAAPVAPSASPTPHPSRSSGPARGSGGGSPVRPAATFAAGYEIRRDWRGGYVARVSVRNAGSAAGNWSVELRVPAQTRMSVVRPLNGTSLTSRQTGDVLRFTGRLAGGGSATFEFLALRSTEESAEILSCTVNGRPC